MKHMKDTMIFKIRFVIPVMLVGIISWTSCTGVIVPNLTEACYRCLCYVTTRCDLSHDCTGGYCGPFNISKIYWIDAGRPTPYDFDSSERTNGWMDCARSYNCAKKIVGEYLGKFVKDCNGDGVTDCYDFMMINGNGGYGCTAPLNRSANGRRWLERYEECRHFL